MSFSVFDRKPIDLHDGCYAWGAKTWDDEEKISLAVSNYCWCPMVFSDERRREKSFLFADWIGLDFDKGPSLKDMTRVFDEYECIIGTTKSHQKIKNPGTKNEEPACDRFRVVLKLEQRCTSVDDFKATTKFLVEKYKADIRAKDAARFFRPCKITFCSAGKCEYERQEIIKYIAPSKKEFHHVTNVSSGMLDNYAHNIMMNWKNNRDRSRNHASYVAALTLKQAGRSMDWAIGFIERRTDLDKLEIERTVKSAWGRQ